MLTLLARAKHKFHYSFQFGYTHNWFNIHAIWRWTTSTQTSKGRAQSCLFAKYISQIVLGLLWNCHKYFAFVSALTQYSLHTVTALISRMFISSITNVIYVVLNWLFKSFLLWVFCNEFWLYSWITKWLSALGQLKMHSIEFKYIFQRKFTFLWVHSWISLSGFMNNFITRDISSIRNALIAF